VLDPRVEYGRRLESRVQTIARRERQHIVIGNLKLAAVVVLLALVWLRYGRQAISVAWLLAPLCAYLGLAIAHEYAIRARTHAETAAAFYRAGLARMEDRWAGTGPAGERFRDGKHIYADDLDLFGHGSLFQLLSTAKLPMGENHLAEWLLRPSAAPRVIERQDLVQELREKLDLREDLAVTGEDLRVRLNPESLTKWCEGLPVFTGRGLGTLLVVLSFAAAATLLYAIYTRTYWEFIIVLAIEGGLTLVGVLFVVVGCDGPDGAGAEARLERLGRDGLAEPAQPVAEDDIGPAADGGRHLRRDDADGDGAAPERLGPDARRHRRTGHPPGAPASPGHELPRLTVNSPRGR